jgi:hypothetical protein
MRKTEQGIEMTEQEMVVEHEILSYLIGLISSRDAHE